MFIKISYNTKVFSIKKLINTKCEKKKPKEKHIFSVFLHLSSIDCKQLNSEHTHAFSKLRQEVLQNNSPHYATNNQNIKTNDVPPSRRSQSTAQYTNLMLIENEEWM